MGGATIGAGKGALSPHLAKVRGTGGQNMSSTYYTHVTKSILYTFTRWGISPSDTLSSLDVWFRPA